MGGDDDGWTTVSTTRSKYNDKRNRKWKPRTGSNHKSKPVNLNGKLTNSILHDAENDLEPNFIYKAILECMERLSLTSFYRESLLTNLRNARVVIGNEADETKIECIKDTDNNIFHGSDISVDEIVCLGIGNFGKKLYSVPMLQLACALLLQRDLDNLLEKNSQQKPRTSIIYFEPMITKVEKEVLCKFDRLLVMNENMKGKHNIPEGKSILFYLPHCPMRIYSNIVWANWGKNIVENAVLLGNSFKAYDERIISTHEREDKSNCVLISLPFVYEWKITAIDKNVRVNDDDLLKHLSYAFNDCCIIRFDDGLANASRPIEHFINCADVEIL